MKFFRKYNKHLLAVFMVLLMVVFLGGSALESLWTPGLDRVVAHSDLGDISFLDQQRAARSTQILWAVGLDWRQPYGALGKPLTEIDWILLTREAEQYGTETQLAAARTWLGEDLGPDRVDFIARRLNIKPDRIYRAVGELRSVQTTTWAVSNAAIPSAAEVRKAARDALDKVRVTAVVFPASGFVNEEAEFTEEELNAQLEAHREKEAGLGLNFGYYVAPVLQVQFVRIQRDRIAEAIGVPNLERKAKTYYDEHLTDPAFARPPEEMPTPEDEIEIEGPQPEILPYLEWEEVREIAMDIVRKQYADEAARRIAGWIADYTAEAWLEAERGEDAYKIAPPQVTGADYYAEVIKRIPASIRYSDAVKADQTEFFSEAEAPEVPLLGDAWARDAEAGRQRSLQTLAFKTKAIVPEIPRGENVNPVDYLAMFQPCPYPLTDADGNIYLFRVADAKPGHPAESVDEVREQLVEDLRLLRAYEVARTLAEALRVEALEQGLSAAYDGDAELQSLKEAIHDDAFGLFTPPPFSRVRPYEVAAGRQSGGIQVMDLGWLPDEAVDQCFALEEAGDKLAVLEFEDRATVMLVEGIEIRRGREDEFDNMKKTLVPRFTANRRREAAREWLDPEQVRARNRFEWATGDG